LVRNERVPATRFDNPPAPEEAKAMHRSQSVNLFAISALSLTAVLTFAGCGDDSNPASPGGGSAGTEIGPGGGVFAFAGGDVTLLVPADALAGTVTVRVTATAGVPSDPGRVPGTCYTCEPETLSFLQPVTVVLAYDDAEVPDDVAESSLRVCRVAGGAWQEVGASSVDAAGNTVSAPIATFGSFGLVGTVTSAGPIYDGNYTITDAASLAAFAGYVGITGNLEIASYAPDPLVVPALETIGGRLRLFGPAQAAHTLRTATLPALRSVGSLLQIENCDSLRTLSLPLCSAIGALDVQRNYALRNLAGLSALTALNPENLAFHGGMQFWLNDQLTNLDGLASLTGTARAVTIKENSSLSNLDGLGGIAYVDGSVEIAECHSLTTLDGLGLRTVGESCVVRSCNALVDLRGLDLLTSVGTYLQIEGCPLLEDLTGLGQIGVCGLLAVQFNNNLASLDGLGPLQQITGSSLILNHNGQLADISALQFLTHVHANLQIEYCPQLATLTGLEALTHVGGDLRLNTLHSLTDVDALSNLVHAWGHLRIQNCVRLESVQGLWGLQPNPATGYVCRSFYIVGNAQAGTPPSGLTNAKAEELLAMIGGAAMVEGEITIADN
jgi:hypothetical protein